MSFCFFSFKSNRYGEALVNYEKGLDANALNKSELNEETLAEHKKICEYGIARTCIKLGNYKKGVSNTYQLKVYYNILQLRF